MPVYNYKCKYCQETFELLQKIDSVFPDHCINCNAPQKFLERIPCIPTVSRVVNKNDTNRIRGNVESHIEDNRNILQQQKQSTGIYDPRKRQK